MNLISILKRASCRLSTFSKLTLSSTVLLLSACGISDLKPNFKEFSYYLLNPNTGAFCKGYDAKDSNKHCKSLIVTNFNHLKSKTIESAYQQKITEPNRVTSLINIILSGDNITYTPTLLDDGYYKLPINKQTNSVWTVVSQLTNT